MTWSEETITTTRIITYAYDVTSRLQTSKVDVESTTWYYRHDGNGNLVEMTPNGSNPTNGAIRYTYNTANQLNQIETHNGSAYVALAQMAYDGIGSRVVLTGWVSGIAYTTTYASRIAGKVQILQATSGANSTSYLYGLNQVGEFGSQSVYYLTDGAGSVRHLVDPNGAVKLARIYEPFGQILMQIGIGDPTYGYLGAQFDRISGLLYINGAYYDPVTGRFLSPVGDGQNPYVPLGGAALAPILILALLGRRKKGKIWTGWVIVALMVSAGLSVAACGGQPTPSRPTTPVAYTPPPKNPTLNIYTPTPTSISTGTSTPPLASQLPPVLPDCPTPPATPTLFIGTPAPIPPTPNCTPTADEPYCINPAVDDLRTMVTHVIYKEAGILGQQGMRNVAQVIRNRVGAPGFADTVLGVISQGNGIHFNGWRAPAPRTGNMWSRALETADLLLNESPLSPSPGMESSTVRFFHSCDASLTMEDQYVHKDEGGGRVQFYFDHEPNRQCVAPTPALSPTP